MGSQPRLFCGIICRLARFCAELEALKKERGVGSHWLDGASGVDRGGCLVGCQFAGHL